MHHCFRYNLIAKMPRARRQVILEDPARPVTPDMAETKLCKSLRKLSKYFITVNS